MSTGMKLSLRTWQSGKTIPTNMNAIKFVGICLAGLLAVHSLLLGQEPNNSSPAIRAKVVKVTDRRDSRGSALTECDVQLEFIGDSTPVSGEVRRVHITKALDESGRNLAAEKDAVFHSFRYTADNPFRELKAEVSLRNTARNASQIWAIEGDVDFSSPSESNGGVLTIADILKQPGKPVQHPALEKFGIKVIHLTKESFEARKKKLDVEAAKEAESNREELHAMLSFTAFFAGFAGTRRARTPTASGFSWRIPRR